MDPKKFFYSMLAVCVVLIVLFGLQFAAPGSPVAALAVAAPVGSCGSEGCSAFPIAMYLLFAAIIVLFIVVFAGKKVFEKE